MRERHRQRTTSSNTSSCHGIIRALEGHFVFWLQSSVRRMSGCMQDLYTVHMGIDNHLQQYRKAQYPAAIRDLLGLVLTSLACRFLLVTCRRRVKGVSEKLEV